MIDYLLCADWSKEQKGRALYTANLQTREVNRVEALPLTFDIALEHARRLADKGRVLLSFDVPLGLPESYFSAIRNVEGWQNAASFTSFLPMAARTPTFFVSGAEARRWSLRQPFFAVPPGPGSKAAFQHAAAGMGIQLHRNIDIKTGGNPMFITSGIPGSVGSAAIDIWIRLADLLPRSRDFRVWPFEGALDDAFAGASIVIAENYPRAAYAAALSSVKAANRPRLKVFKTRSETRHEAIGCLLSAPWVVTNRVRLFDTDAALADENQFDALVTTAGLLRLLMDGEPLSSPVFEDPVAEGGILGTGTINFDLPEANFAGGQTRHVASLDGRNDHLDHMHHCPIPGCTKVFHRSRGGWDGHVGALRMHPNWQPRLVDHGKRLDLFRAQFPEFFL
jgi:hypothetical protein